jgi:dienelactone hydrolase
MQGNEQTKGGFLLESRAMCCWLCAHMRNWIITLLGFLSVGASAQNFAARGPYSVGEQDVTVVRTNGTTFGAMLFYPALSAGSGAAADHRGAPFPAISFGHGFLCPPSLYAGTMSHIASWGFIVIATRSGLELFPSHSAYAADISRCLHWLREQSRAPSGLWRGVVSTNRWGVSGHSMGGGSGILAAADDPEIQAVGNMAAAETRPSAIAAAKRVHVPVCLLAGSQDALVPPDLHTHPMFENANPPKQFIELQGGWHCGFVDVPLPDAVCDEGSMPRQEQLARSRAILTAFFRLTLADDAAARWFIWGPRLPAEAALSVENDAGFRFDPPFLSQRVSAGGTAIFHATLGNNLPEPTGFSFSAAGNTQSLAVTPGHVPVLLPGDSTDITVRVSLPPGRRLAPTILTATPDIAPHSLDFILLGVGSKK